MSNFLEDLALFMLIVLGVIFIAGAATLKRKGIDLKDFIKNSNGAVRSALVAIAGVILIALSIFLLPNNANAGEWFNDAGVYVGLDYTLKDSPQCESADPIDSRGTSNLGAWFNIWQRESVRVNARYTHHSCFLGEDDLAYDGFGIQAEWQLWERKR